MDLDKMDLRDARAKLTAPSDQMLEAVSRATGKDKSELIREIVHAWYLAKWKENQMINRLFKGVEGIGAAGEGGAIENVK